MPVRTECSKESRRGSRRKLYRAMALKDAVNRVLERTRALVDGKDSKTSFEEKMELLKQSVRALTVVVAAVSLF